MLDSCPRVSRGPPRHVSGSVFTHLESAMRDTRSTIVAMTAGRDTLDLTSDLSLRATEMAMAFHPFAAVIIYR
jgi:hypothetical protein